MSGGASNMSLEDILRELTRYGRPTVNQFASSATPGLRAGGSWGVEVSIPSRWSDTDRETRDRLDVPVTGWRMIGRGDLREAAEQCLEKCLALAEGPLAPYAKFITTDMVKGK